MAYAGGWPGLLLGKERGERGPQEVGPHDYRENTLPEGELKEADGKQPSGDPEQTRGAVLLDLDPIPGFHLGDSSFWS